MPAKTREDALSAISTATHHRKKTKQSEANQAELGSGLALKAGSLRLGEIFVIGGRSAHGGDVPSVDPTLLRSRGVGHLHPTIFAPYHSEFGVLCHHADSWR